ncbi:kinase-like domain-containing protein [Phyllosticta capitalensis]
MSSPGPYNDPKEQPEEPNALTETHVFISTPSYHVERRPGKLVVKYGREVKNCEREALAYASSLNLPVPRLHDDLPNPDADGNNVCIWMDYVDGDVLEHMWPSMTAEQKLDIAKQLRDILSVMRRQKSTTGKIESCGGGELTDLRTYSSHSGGPFSNEAAFQQWHVDSLYTQTPKDVRDAIAQGLRRYFSNHQVVFTHGDLSQRNIIVKENRIQALLDWEYAGWYPEHWEYVKFLHMASKNKDWQDYVDTIFPEKYLDELFAFEALLYHQNPW